MQGGETPFPSLVIRLTVFSLFLAALWAAPRSRAVWRPLDLPAALFLFYTLLSTGWAAYPWAAYQLAMNVLCVGLVYLLLRTAGTQDGGERDASRVMAVVLLAATAQVTYELFQHFSGQSARPAGSFANPNFLADYLFFGAVISLYFGGRVTAHGFRPGKIPYFALTVLMVYGIYLTHSRAMVPVAAGVFLFLVLVVREERKTLYLAGAGGGVALLLAAVASRFSTAVDPYALGRFYIWKAAWKTAVAHPFGVGLGGYRFFWLRYREPIESSPFHYGKTANTAHSQFFGILSELGFPGILLALAIAGSVLVLARRESRREDRILPLCLIPLGAMIHAIFDVNLDIFAIVLPVAVCVALLANRNARAAGEGILLPPVLRAGLALIPLLCIGYSAASYLGLARYHRGLDRLKEGNTIQAMDDFSSARRFDPLCSAYPDAVSSVHFRWYLQTRKPEYLAAAVNMEQEAHNASPEDSLHLSQAGFLLGELAEAVPREDLRRGYRGYALSALSESLRKDPYSVIALFRTAEIWKRAGDAGKARAALERLIGIEPNAAQAYVLLARWEEGEDPRRAAAHYRKAIALSLEFEGKPLESWQRDLLRIDRKEVRRRLDELEQGQFSSSARGQ